MVTWSDLVAVDVAAVRAAAAGWRRLATATGDRCLEVSGVVTALPEVWGGPAARAALARTRSLNAVLADCGAAFVGFDQALTWYADQLDTAQQRALAAADRAAPDRPMANWAAAEIEAATAQAVHADAVTAARLHDLTARLAGAPADAAGLTTPACGAPPETVARWWSGLTEAQRWALITDAPQLIGPLDGVPVEARDQANRLRLQQIRAELAARQRELAGQPGARTALDRLDSLVASVDAINGRLQAAVEPRAYLLGLDVSGAGRAIVAIGNPDTADNVVTFVPGVGSGIGQLSTEISRAERLVQRAEVQAPDERTAAIVWLDYQRPNDLLAAARDTAATQAEIPLDRFVDGLHETAQAGGAHYTVVGHSYGSVVVGYADRDVDLAADDLVFVGSPGTGVDRADQLNTSPGHVWASTAEHDVIKAAARLPTVGLPSPLRPALGLDVEQMWFGRNPTDPDFGGHVFTSDPGSPWHPIDAHNAYFDNGGAGLANLARIVVGGDAYAEVR